MSATCAVGCGVCCDPVVLPFPLARLLAWTADRWRSMGDPRDDAVWAAWPEQTLSAATGEELREVATQVWDYCQAGGDRPNADFAAQHWTQLYGPEQKHLDGAARVVCDAFDRHTRTCTMQEGKPPVCDGYPRYGAEPGDPSISYRSMDPACSYNADVRTFLPIVEVR